MPRRLCKRDEDRNAHLWVESNYDLKKELKAKNGGVMPETPAFTTSSFEGSDTWSEENPPDILFYLEPPKSQFEDWEPQRVLDSDGNVVMSPNDPDVPLRDMPILPDRVSINVSGWMLTAWRRLDPRITLQDVIDRMTTNLGNAQQLTELVAVLPKKNHLQNNCQRNCRKLLKHYNDFGKTIEPHRAELEALEGLTNNNIRYNTILEYHPDFRRLIKVKWVRKNAGGMLSVKQKTVTEDNLQETTYPLDHFIQNNQTSDLTTSMQEALTTLYTLQERALKHGLEYDQWRRLPRSCLPKSWYDRTSEKTEPNDTYDGGCEICTWTPFEDKEEVNNEANGDDAISNNEAVGDFGGDLHAGTQAYLASQASLFPELAPFSNAYPQDYSVPQEYGYSNLLNGQNEPVFSLLDEDQDFTTFADYSGMSSASQLQPQVPAMGVG